MQETCGVCGRQVPLGSAVHVLLHAGEDAGVVDHYVCRRCYEDDLAPLFE